MRVVLSRGQSTSPLKSLSAIDLVRQYGKIWRLLNSSRKQRPICPVEGLTTGQMGYHSCCQRGLYMSCELLPVSWSTPNGSSCRRIQNSRYAYLISWWSIPLSSHAALNSFGVSYAKELLGRTALYSRRNHASFACAAFTSSNSTLSRNSSR